jgi:hypothetical protein
MVMAARSRLKRKCPGCSVGEAREIVGDPPLQLAIDANAFTRIEPESKAQHVVAIGLVERRPGNRAVARDFQIDELEDGCNRGWIKTSK